MGHHRRKLDGFSTDELPSSLGKPALRLTVLFRLAVLLNRSRRTVESPPILLRASGKRLKVLFDRGWLRENHLTRADLEQERGLAQGRGSETPCRPSGGFGKFA